MDISQGSVAAAASVIAVAGVGEAALDSMPKGLLILMTMTLLGIVFFFVRRDAARYAKRFDAMEKAITKGRCSCCKRSRRRRGRK